MNSPTGCGIAHVHRFNQVRRAWRIRTLMSNIALLSVLWCVSVLLALFPSIVFYCASV
uniref:Uncharacterized protein n=1 Tax=Chrysemys picta bellii TaxID=8478 RepID=A0A8C3FNY3_CHRPI